MSRERSSGWVPRWCRPHDTSEVVVSRPPATKFHHDGGDLVVAQHPAIKRGGNQSGGDVVGGVLSSEHGEVSQLAPHVRLVGHRALVTLVGGLIGRGGVEEVGVVLPVGRPHAHHLEREHRGNRGGVVEHQSRPLPTR